VTQLLNDHGPVEQNLLSLAGHLTDPQDRERYAALISYFHSLPPGDELFRLVELLGLLSLMGQRVPEALAEFLTELRNQAKASAEYYGQVDERLARLPQEIAAGIDAGAIAKTMSEAFRQQIAATGLADTARLLGTSVAGLQKLSGEISVSLKPVTNQYAGIGATISAELTKLANASSQLRQHNANLVAQVADERWQWKVFCCAVLLFMGFFLGLLLEKRGSTDTLVDLQTQMNQMQFSIKPTTSEASPAGLRRRASHR
jgi:hypothetical protein